MPYTTTTRKHEPKFMASWRQPTKTSPDTSPSPPTTRPTTPSSSSSSSSSEASRSRSSSQTSSSSSNWRTGSPPRLTKAGLPTFKETEDGHILYLPLTPIPSSSIIKKHPNQSKPEDHPIVVLGKRVERGVEIVTFRLLTSLGGRALESEAKEERHRHFFHDV